MHVLPNTLWFRTTRQRRPPPRKAANRSAAVVAPVLLKSCTHSTGEIARKRTEDWGLPYHVKNKFGRIMI